MESIYLTCNIRARVQLDPQHLCNPLQLCPPICQQRIVTQQHSSTAAAGVYRLQQIARPQQFANGRRQAISPCQRTHHFLWWARHQHHAQRYAAAFQHTLPQRQQTTQARVFDCPQRNTGKVALHDGNQRIECRLRSRRCQPIVRQWPRVIPSAFQRSQQALVHRHHIGMLPEPGRVIRAGRHQVLSQCHAVQIEHTCECRGAAAVHPQHQQGHWGNRYRLYFFYLRHATAVRRINSVSLPTQGAA